MSLDVAVLEADSLGFPEKFGLQRCLLLNRCFRLHLMIDRQPRTVAEVREWLPSRTYMTSSPAALSSLYPTLFAKTLHTQSSNPTDRRSFSPHLQHLNVEHLNHTASTVPRSRRFSANYRTYTCLNTSSTKSSSEAFSSERVDG
jgi:hypothetical protein